MERCDPFVEELDARVMPSGLIAPPELAPAEICPDPRPSASEPPPPPPIKR